jgi:cytochrome P450
MPSILAFWLLARVVYTPKLLGELRAEVAPAFKDGIHSRPDMEYLMTCPKLNATFHETLRVHGGAAGFRRVVSDTTVAGHTFKTGNDVIMTYRQLHNDREIWGPDAESFDINRFIENPKLATGRTFKPFGGGLALCYGRLLVRQTALCFLATLVTRYDMEVVGDCPFPGMDEKVPQVGVILPMMDQIPKIRIREVTAG